jgi:hypothetical protein
MFAKGFVKENQVLERLGTQKHEHAIGELDLKCCKLENKAMEKQHQHEHKREQHEFCIMQMQVLMSQGQQAVPAMQSQNHPLFEGLGLMGELNDTMPPSEFHFNTL